MNDVNRTVARKLRSAAAALRADAAASNFVNLREALLTEIVELEERADTLEEQAKPEEPTEWSSVVVAGCIDFPERVRWHLGSDGYWHSERLGYGGAWRVLKDPEVLRVGVGPQPLAEWESDLLNEQHRRGVAAAVLAAMDVDQYLIDAVANARPR